MLEIKEVLNNLDVRFFDSVIVHEVANEVIVNFKFKEIMRMKLSKLYGLYGCGSIQGDEYECALGNGTAAYRLSSVVARMESRDNRLYTNIYFSLLHLVGFIISKDGSVV
jgi:hypothetical protein